MGKITACWVENDRVLFLSELFLELFLKQDTGKQWSLRHNNTYIPTDKPTHTVCLSVSVLMVRL